MGRNRNRNESDTLSPARNASSSSPQTLEEVQLAQAKADLRVTLLIGDKKEVELKQQKVDLEKSELELRLLRQKVQQGAGAD